MGDKVIICTTVQASKPALQSYVENVLAGIHGLREEV